MGARTVVRTVIVTGRVLEQMAKWWRGRDVGQSTSCWYPRATHWRKVVPKVTIHLVEGIDGDR